MNAAATIAAAAAAAIAAAVVKCFTVINCYSLYWQSAMLTVS